MSCLANRRLHQTTVRLREVSHRLGQQLGTFDRASQPAFPVNPASAIMHQMSQALASPKADDPSFATSFTPQPSMGLMQPDVSQPGTGRKSRHHSTQEELALMHGARTEVGPGLQTLAHASFTKPPSPGMLQLRSLMQGREVKKLSHSRSAGVLHCGSPSDLGKLQTPAAAAELQLGSVAAVQRLTLGAAEQGGSSRTAVEPHARDAALPALLVAGHGAGTPSAPHPSVSKALGAMGGDLKVRIIRAQHIMAGGVRSTAVYRAKVRGYDAVEGFCKRLSIQVHAVSCQFHGLQGGWCNTLQQSQVRRWFLIRFLMAAIMAVTTRGAAWWELSHTCRCT